MPNDLSTPGGLLAKEIAELTTRRIDEVVAKIEPPAGKDGLGFDVKTYAKGHVYREDDYVVTAWGKVYVAVRDTADAPRKSDAWKRVGPWGLEFIGLKPEDTSTLECGDLYIDGGSLFGVLPDGRVKMLVQRGREGKQGPAGVDGKDGRHGASIVAAVVDGHTLRFRQDDGSEFEASFEGLHNKLFHEAEKAGERGAERYMKAFYEEFIVDDKSILINVHRGPWQPDTAYRVGDLVNHANGLYLCKKAQARGGLFDQEHWHKLAGAGGGGGASGPTTRTFFGAGDFDTSRTDQANNWGMPVGTVIHSVSKTPPLGFYPCDGGLIPKHCGELIKLTGADRTPVVNPGDGLRAYVYGGVV
jgi:hypothetical protein